MIKKFFLLVYPDSLYLNTGTRKQTKIEKEKVMATHIFTTFYMTSEIFFMRPHPTSPEAFGIVSDIVFLKLQQSETQTYGYARPMAAKDIISGSCAQVGWCGFFASDGDIVF